MRFCENCGTKLDDQDEFCPNCGKPVTKGESSYTNRGSIKDYSKWFTGKNRWYIAGVIIVIVLLGGFWWLYSTSSSQKTASWSNTASGKLSTSKNNTSKTSISSKLWDSSKDGQLNSFIESWEPNMNQSYAKLTSSDYSNKNFKNNTVDNSSAKIGWSKDGTGSYDYNVVAMYNYNKQGTAASAKIGEQHITYAFAFHNDQPIALVSETSNGNMNWSETQNSDVKSNFASIAGNASSSTSSSSPSSSSTSQPSQSAIAVMAYMKAKGISDANSIGTLKENSEDGYDFIGENRFIKYSINGDSVTADGQTYNLSDLENEYYKTPSQKSAVESVASRIQGAKKDYGNGWSEYKNE